MSSILKKILRKIHGDKIYKINDHEVYEVTFYDNDFDMFIFNGQKMIGLSRYRCDLCKMDIYIDTEIKPKKLKYTDNDFTKFTCSEAKMKGLLQ